MMDIDKIRDEMAQKANHPGIAMIGEYVTERVSQGAAIPEGKTLQGAFDAIHQYASKHRTGNYAFVPPAKAYEIVDSYFGLGAREEEPRPAAPPAAVADDLDLDALLGW